jgi:hypothetical protein
MQAMRILRALAICLLLVTLGLVSAPAGAASYDTHLTRAPYLTDLVGLHVIVNFATDQSGTVASVTYGPFDGTSCVLSSAQSATRTTVKVGTVSEYQWKASLALPSGGRYCYRCFWVARTCSVPATPGLHHAGRSRLVAAVLVRGLRRLGPRRRERQQPGSAESARNARRERRPLRRDNW